LWLFENYISLQSNLRNVDCTIMLHVAARLHLFQWQAIRSMSGGTGRVPVEGVYRKGPDASKELLMRAFERATVGIMIKDAEGRPWECNSAFRRMLGYDEEEFRGTARFNFTFPGDADKDTELYGELVRGERYSFQLEKRYVRKDGSVMWGRLSAFLVEGSDDEPAFVFGIVEDIDERKRAEEALRISERRFRTVIEQSPLSIHVFTPDGRFLAANSSWNELWNLEQGKEPEDYDIFEDEQLRATGLVPYIEESIKEGLAVATPPLLHDPAKAGREGRKKWIEAFVYPVRDEEGRISEMTLVVEDITERKVLEDELAHRALHDPLTGLPNRALFLNCLEHAVARTQRRDDSLAVLFLDLDDFKVVNDSLRHEVGDQLLVAVGQRLKGCLRPSDIVARLGGDEFIVLLEGVSGVGDAEEVAERIIRELKAPFTIQGRFIFVTASIGIALSSATGGESGDLLRAADIAMYRAKDRAKARYEVFDRSKDAHALERLELENDLRKAIERDELRVHYQPVFSLVSDYIAGMEALLRWEHPKRGTMSPAEFIPLAEETGLIVPTGRWVLEEACRQAREWQEQYPSDPPLIMGVNLSLRQFQHPGLAGDVAQILRETGLDPGNLALEITESVAMHDVNSTIATLEKLKSLGVWLVIDDFGTGNSSLMYLTSRFKMEHLKIDGSFIREFLEDPDNSAIIPGLIAFAHVVGLRVIAEGVETADQLRRLKEMGCEFVQGYHIAKPMTPAAASELLAGEALSSGGRS
jgi:diguanylate cyclase (GGDEF)-like protein/PAS domain S-box-containing protein